MSNKVVVLIVTTLLLASCGSLSHRKEGTPATTATTPTAGGYLEGDGPDGNVPANIDSIPDAVPRIEPLHRYANRPYIALGKTYTPLTSVGSFKERGVASWYGKKFNGERTSSGEIYDMYAMTAAHPTLPLPSYVRVTNLANNKSVVVRINDRGPFINDRIIDLSYTAAHKLGIIGSGSAEVEVESIAANEGVKTITPVLVQSQPLENSTPVSAVAATPVIASAVPPAPTSPVAIAPVGSTEPGVFLQLGAFESQQNAEVFMEKMRGQLNSTGKQFKLSNKNGLVRVHIGPYSSESEARSSADALENKLGFKPMVNLP